MGVCNINHNKCDCLKTWKLVFILLGVALMISTLIMASTSQYFKEVDGEMLVDKGSVFVNIVDGLGIGSIASTGIGLGLTIGQKIHKWRKSDTHWDETKIYSGKHATMSIILHILLSGAIITSAAMVLCGVFPMPEVIPMDFFASFHTLFSTFLVPSIIGGAGLLGMVAFGFYDFWGIGSSVQYPQVATQDFGDLDLRSGGFASYAPLHRTHRSHLPKGSAPSRHSRPNQNLSGTGQNAREPASARQNSREPIITNNVRADSLSWLTPAGRRTSNAAQTETIEGGRATTEHSEGRDRSVSGSNASNIDRREPTDTVQSPPVLTQECQASGQEGKDRPKFCIVMDDSSEESSDRATCRRRLSERLNKMLAR